jgi:DNA primase
VDFHVIKQSVSIEMVLSRYGITLRKVNQNSLRGQCPLPTHNAEKSSPSFSVNLQKNAWACLSRSCIAARRGKRGGNQLDLVSWMEGGCSVREAALKLAEWFNVSSDARGTSPPASKAVPADASPQLAAEEKEEREVTDSGVLESVNTPLTFVLKSVTADHPYFTTRGITRETAAHFGMGFFSGRGSMSGRIVIPIHNKWGELVAYAGRALDESEPKYKLPGGFRKSLELFNLHRVLSLEADTVIVVEGFFDTAKVHQAGYAAVVALMGSAMSQEQEDALAQFQKIILILDGNDAGREAATMIAPRLMHRTFVKVTDLREGSEPDRLSSEEIRSILGSL